MEQKLTVEVIKQAMEKLRKTMPTFPELDKMIANGAKIENLFLIIPTGITQEHVLHTRYGPLALLPSVYVDKGYLFNNRYSYKIQGGLAPWKTNHLA